MTVFNMTKEKRYIFFVFSLVSLFTLAPLFTTDNVGGIGLELTFNIPVWGVASWFIALSLIFILQQRILIIPKAWPYLIAFPVVVVIIGLTQSAVDVFSWIFTQLYILGGLAFIAVLFQYKVRQGTLDRVLLYTSFGVAIHALIGILQMHNDFLGLSWLPPNIGNLPRGIFQQINVQASFMTTGIAIQLYLITRPSYKSLCLLKKIAFFISFGTMIYVVIGSGSRLALLATFLVVVMMFIGHYKIWLNTWRTMIVLIGLSLLAVVFNQTGLDSVADKTVQISTGHSGSARVAIYAITLQEIQEKPITGYGIGSFRSVWNQGASDFVKEHPEAIETLSLRGSLNHPHNELFMWLLEAGLLGVVGIVVFTFGVVRYLIKCGRRGGSYAAMLLPISLQTQVEFPFYISAAHWFLWLFLIYLVFRHHVRVIRLNKSEAGLRWINLSPLLAAGAVTFFLSNTSRAQMDLFTFIYEPEKNVHNLRLAIDNVYFSDRAERVAMRNMLYVSLDNNDREKIQLFENWALGYIEYNPRLKVYTDLIQASAFLRPEQKGCDIVQMAYEMYGFNKGIIEQYQQCLSVK